MPGRLPIIIPVIVAMAFLMEQLDSTIITTAVKDVAGTLGGFATDLFEIRDAARRASEDHGEPGSASTGPGPERLHADPDASSPTAAPGVHPDPDAPAAG